VEALLSQSREMGRGPRQAAMRSRKELVPRGKPCARTVDDNLELALRARAIDRTKMTVHQREEIIVERALNALVVHAVAATIFQSSRGHQERRTSRRRLRAPRRRARQLRALGELDRHVLVGSDLFLKTRAPRREAIGPRLNDEIPTPDAVDD